jgi:hypothetical protein
MTVPDPGPPAPPRGPDPLQQLAAARRTARTAAVIAVTSLAVAAIAVVLALASLAKARSTTSATASTAASGAGSGTVSSQPVASTSGAAAVTRSMPVATASVRPDADFKIEYEKKALRVTPMSGCELRYVDLDEPRVGVAQAIAEFGYGGPCGGGPKPAIDVEDELPISMGNDNAIARDCAEAIRTGPINEPVVPADQTSLCLLTSASAAEKEGITRKLVLVTIDSIAADGTLNLLVTAWNVPS